MPLAREQRKLAAIVAADVVGYSRLMGRDESGTLARLRKNRSEYLNPVLTKYGGRLVKLTGDGALVEFASAVDALSAAIEFQQAMAEANRDQPADTALVFRVGLHLGDLIVDGDDLYGDGVNVAARLEREAPAGGILISRNVRDAVAGRVKATFEDLGGLSLKNIDRPVRAFRVHWEALDWPTQAAPEAPAAPATAPTIPLPLPDKPSIAVLPFQNMSDDPEQEYFADGIVEDIITALSRFRSLFVIARNSSFAYKGKSVDVKQVGRELGVRYVLEGSVRKVGGRVRITGQLVESESGIHLWADRFDSPLESIFDLQDQITTSVVSIVSSKVSQAEIVRALRKPVSNLDAYDSYLRGFAKWQERTRDSNDEALRLFYRAIDLDPAFPASYAMAARCYNSRKVQGWVEDKEKEVAEARRLAMKAASLGQDDERSLASAGQTLAWMCRDYEVGEILVEQAVSLNPNSAFCLQMKAYVSLYLGKHEEAIEQITKVLRLNPLDPSAATSEAIMANALVLLGRYDESLKWSAKALVRHPNWLLGMRIAVVGHALAGDLEEARRLATCMHQLDPGMRISNLREFLPYRRPEDVELLIEGMRLAGLPE
jgi:TolB-like protein/class 3 adenylate cyclase